MVVLLELAHAGERTSLGQAPLGTASAVRPREQVRGARTPQGPRPGGSGDSASLRRGAIESLALSAPTGPSAQQATVAVPDGGLQRSGPPREEPSLLAVRTRGAGTRGREARRQDPIVVDEPEWHPGHVEDRNNAPEEQAQPVTPPPAGPEQQQQQAPQQPAAQPTQQPEATPEPEPSLAGTPPPLESSRLAVPDPKQHGAPTSIHDYKDPPRDARKKETWVFWFCTVFPCIVVGAICLFAFIYYFGLILGSSIKAGIENFDQDFIGVDVTIGKLVVSPLKGYIHVVDFVVHNPPGYKTPHMMKALNVKVDIDMWALAKSRGKKLEVDILHFEGFEVIFEKRSMTESNFSHVLHFLKKKEEEEGIDPALKKTEAKAKVTMAESESPRTKKKKHHAASGEQPKSASDDIILDLHEVLISDIGARVAAGSVLGGAAGFRVFHLSEIDFEDFAETVGEAPWKSVVKVLLKSVLKVFLADIIGERAASWVI